jgi:hypothetical protein
MYLHEKRERAKWRTRGKKGKTRNEMKRKEGKGNRRRIKWRKVQNERICLKGVDRRKRGRNSR